MSIITQPGSSSPLFFCICVQCLSKLQGTVDDIQGPLLPGQHTYPGSTNCPGCNYEFNIWSQYITLTATIPPV